MIDDTTTAILLLVLLGGYVLYLIVGRLMP